MPQLSSKGGVDDWIKSVSIGVGATERITSMGLFQKLRERKFRRRYVAALTIYEAAYTYKQLSRSDQQRICEWIRHMIDDWFNPAFSYKEFELFLPMRGKAPFWAVAMKALDIPPAIPGEVWQFPAQVRRWSRIRLANKLILDWRLLSEGTTQAADYLTSKGVDVAAIDLGARN
jgi:hypothetical protein